MSKVDKLHKLISRNSYPKVNLFLKIVGVRNNYHLLFSRFIRVKNIHDQISFYEKPHRNNEFTISTNLNLSTQENIIYKIYLSLINYLNSQNRQNLVSRINDFFDYYSIEVIKNIPVMAGLGGGSSNGAVFLNMLNEYLNLNLDIHEKIVIVQQVGSDIPFFLYEINSANVSGIGEIVEPFDEVDYDIEIFTPTINCNTGSIYREFRSNFFNITHFENINDWKDTNSRELFIKLKDNREFANDLWNPARIICPELNKIDKEGFLFSGSGSSFFRINI